MSTRGAWGFHFRGKTLATYNHCDSYPAGLGRKVLRFVRDNDIEEIKKMAGELIPVDACDTPPAEDRKALGKYRNSRVNDGADEWYNLLHRVQSDPQAYLDDPDLRAFIDSTSFLEDSPFCEWAYVVNLDEGFLEIYKGFRTEPPKFSRYYDEKTFEPEILPSGRRSERYPVEQVAAVAFADIKSGHFTEENFDCRTDGIADIEAHPPRPPALTPGAIGCSIVPEQSDKRIMNDLETILAEIRADQQNGGENMLTLAYKYAQKALGYKPKFIHKLTLAFKEQDAEGYPDRDGEAFPLDVDPCVILLDVAGAVSVEVYFDDSITVSWRFSEGAGCRFPQRHYGVGDPEDGLWRVSDIDIKLVDYCDYIDGRRGIPDSPEVSVTLVTKDPAVIRRRMKSGDAGMTPFVLYKLSGNLVEVA